MSNRYQIASAIADRKKRIKKFGKIENIFAKFSYKKKYEFQS